jgi:hypothetical protein
VVKERCDVALKLLSTCYFLPVSVRDDLTAWAWDMQHYLRLPEVAAELGAAQVRLIARNADGTAIGVEVTATKLVQPLVNEWTVANVQRAIVEQRACQPLQSGKINVLGALLATQPGEARARLALASNVETVRAAAASSLDDRDLLGRIGAQDASEGVRLVAIERLKALSATESK